MNGVNLIPKARRRARAQRTQVRLWAGAVAGCALILACVHGALWSMWREGASGDLAAESQKLAKEIAAAERLDKNGQMRVRDAKAAANAAREIADQPDWGALLALVAGKLGPEAALDAIRLEPVSKPSTTAAKAPSARPEHPSKPVAMFTLVLSGVAKTQDAASNVAIELRQTELFATVKLVETRRMGFMGSAAVAFRIDCSIAGVGGAD